MALTEKEKDEIIAQLEVNVLTEDTKQPRNLQPSTGLSFELRTLLCTIKDGELVEVEDHNGTIKRWTCEPSTRGKSLEIRGADRAKV